MKYSIINCKTILGIDSNMDFLEDLKKTILNACPECWFDKASSFSHGQQYMAMISYDLVILDIMSSPGNDLLVVTKNHDLPVLALLNDEHSLKALSHSNGLRIRAAINKQNLTDLVPAIEYVLKLECRAGWKRALINPGRYLKSSVSGLIPKNLRSDTTTYETFLFGGNAMQNTMVKHNEMQGIYSQNGILPATVEVSETEDETSRNGFLKKLDAFSTWMLCKLLPKSLTSSPPPDRQIYY